MIIKYVSSDVNPVIDLDMSELVVALMAHESIENGFVGIGGFG